MSGVLEILNVGRGDVKISYDTANAAEAIRARRIIKDMMKRGYALLVEVDGKHSRVKAFDETQGEYIIADFDPEGDEEEEGLTADPATRPKALRSSEKRAMRKDAIYDGATSQPVHGAPGERRNRRLRMDKTKATAIGPTAGGWMNCPECDQPMLKKGQRRKDPDDYRHARGCSRASKVERAATEALWKRIHDQEIEEYRV